MSRRLAAIVVVTSLFAVPLARATSPPDERILLPVVVDNAAGAFGSHWTTTITYLYRGFAVIEVGNDVNLNQFIAAGRGELHLANITRSALPAGCSSRRRCRRATSTFKPTFTKRRLHPAA